MEIEVAINRPSSRSIPITNIDLTGIRNCLFPIRFPATVFFFFLLGWSELTMPPRLNLFTARNAVSILRQQPYSSSSSFAASSQKYGASSVRCQHAISSGLGMRASLSSAHLQRRMNSSISGGKGKAELPKESAQPKGPNQDQSPHLREHTKKCDGSAPGSVELEHGTPVDEVGQ